jgi:glutamate--cysteine ligase
VPMREWCKELLDSMQSVCELLDSSHPQRPYVAALRDQGLKIEDVERTPSARLLREMREREQGFEAYALQVSREHKAHSLQSPPPPSERVHEFEAEVEESRQAFAAIEAARRGSFEDYLATYLAD